MAVTTAALSIAMAALRVRGTGMSFDPACQENGGESSPHEQAEKTASCDHEPVPANNHWALHAGLRLSSRPESLALVRLLLERPQARVCHGIPNLA